MVTTRTRTTTTTVMMMMTVMLMFTLPSFCHLHSPTMLSTRQVSLKISSVR